MSQLWNTVVNYFKDDDWNCVEIASGEALKMEISGENGKYDCLAIIDEKQQVFQFLSFVPIIVPESQRLLIAEFLNRVNYEIVLGNFEMDFEDGEVRFRTSIDVAGDRLTAALVGNLVNVNILMIDHFSVGIMKIIYGSLTPQEAIHFLDELEKA